jgi:hypothetical protein
MCQKPKSTTGLSGLARVNPSFLLDLENAMPENKRPIVLVNGLG